MAHILTNWINHELNLTEQVETSQGGLDRFFQSGYHIGELLYTYNLQPDFHKVFHASNTLESAMKNFIVIVKTLRNQLEIELTPSRAYDIMMVKPGAAAQLVYDIKAKLYQKNISATVAPSAVGRKPQLDDDVGTDDLPKGSVNVEIDEKASDRAKARFMDLEYKFFADRLKAKVKRGDRELYIEKQIPKAVPHADLKQALASVNLRNKSPLPPVKGPKKPLASGNDFAHNSAKASKKHAQEEFTQMRQNIEQFEQQQQSFFSTKPAPLTQNNSESSIEDAAAKNATALEKSGFDPANAQLESTVDGQSENADTAIDLPVTTQQTLLRIREKRLEADANRSGREQRRRKLLLSQQNANLDMEKAKFEELLLKNLLHQSRQEQRMAEQLSLSRKEKEIMVENYQFRELQYQQRRQQDFEEALEREREFVRQARLDYKRQLEMQLEQHQSLLERKAHLKHLKNLEFCTKVATDIVELSLKIVDYKDLQAVTDGISNSKAVNVSPYLLQEWKTLFAHGQPLSEIYDFDAKLEVVPLQRTIQENKAPTSTSFSGGSGGAASGKDASSDTSPSSLTGSRATLVRSRSKSNAALSPALAAAASTAAVVDNSKREAANSLQERLQKLKEDVPTVVRRGIDILDNTALDFYIANQGQWAFASSLAGLKDEPAPLNNAVLSSFVHNVLDITTAAAIAAEAEACRQAGQKYQWNLRIALVGKRFAGKTSLANFLSSCFGLQVIDISQSVNRMVRAGDANSNLAKKVQAALLQGKDLDDATLVQVAIQEITSLETHVRQNNFEEHSSANGFVMVDFPRNRAQAALLERELTGFEEPRPVMRGNLKKNTSLAPNPGKDDMKSMTNIAGSSFKTTSRNSGASAGKVISQIVAPNPNAASVTKVDPLTCSVLDSIIFLDTPDADCLKRAVGRRKDPVSGAVYHLDFNPPPTNEPGLLERLVPDDAIPIEQLQHQLSNFNEQQAGLQDWYTRVLPIWFPISTVGATPALQYGPASVAESIEAHLSNLIKIKQQTAAKPSDDGDALAAPVELILTVPDSDKARKEGSVQQSSQRPGAAARATPVNKKTSSSELVETDKHTSGRFSNASRQLASTSANDVSAAVAEVTSRQSSAAASSDDSAVGKIATDGRYLPSKETAKGLAEQWSNTEDHYASSMKFFFRSLRRQRDSTQKYLLDSRFRFKQFLNREDKKQELVNLFQKEYNDVDDDLRSDLDAKAELHQRTEELREKLWEAADAKRDLALHERQAIVEEKFVDESFVSVSNYYIGAMQAELDRFVETRQFMLEYLKECYGEVPESLRGVAQIKLPLSTHAPAELSAIFAALLVPFDCAGGNGEAVGTSSASSRMPGIAGNSSGAKGSGGAAGSGLAQGKGIAGGSAVEGAGGKRLASSTSKKGTGDIGAVPGYNVGNAPAGANNSATSRLVQSTVAGLNATGSNPSLNSGTNISGNAPSAGNVTNIADFQALYKDVTVAYEVAQTLFNLIENAQKAAASGQASGASSDKPRRNTASSGPNAPADKSSSSNDGGALTSEAVLSGAQNTLGEDSTAAASNGPAGSSDSSSGANAVLSAQQLVEESLAAFEQEEKTLKWRLERLHASAVSHLRELRSKAASLYVQLDEWTAGRFQAETDAIRELVSVIKAAIETEMKLPNELLLKGSEFVVDYSSQLIQFPQMTAKGDNLECSSSQFSLIQIVNLSRYLLGAAPSGSLSVSALTDLLRAFVLQQQLRTGEQQTVLPGVIANASPKVLSSVLEAFDLFDTGFVDWRRAVLSYSGWLPLSRELLVSIQSSVSGAKKVKFSEFSALPWFSWLSAAQDSDSKLAPLALFLLFAQKEPLVVHPLNRSRPIASAASHSASVAHEDNVVAAGFPPRSATMSAGSTTGRRRSSFMLTPNSNVVTVPEEPGSPKRADVPTSDGRKESETVFPIVAAEQVLAAPDDESLADLSSLAVLNSSVWTAENSVYVYDNSHMLDDLYFDFELFFSLCSLDADGQLGFEKAWNCFRAPTEGESVQVALTASEAAELLHRDVSVFGGLCRKERKPAAFGPDSFPTASSAQWTSNDPFASSVISLVFKLAATWSIGEASESLTFPEFIRAATKALNKDEVLLALPQIASSANQVFQAAPSGAIGDAESEQEANAPLNVNSSKQSLNFKPEGSKDALDTELKESLPDSSVDRATLGFVCLVNSPMFGKTLENLLHNPVWQYDCVNLQNLDDLSRASVDN